MHKRKKIISLLLILSIWLNPVVAESQTAPFKVVSNTSYKIQQYIGFNYLTKLIGKSIISRVVKKETKAHKVTVNMDIYSGWDLIHKKIKTIEIKAEDLFVEDIPIAELNVESKSPIYVKSYKNAANRKIYGVSDSVDIVADIQSDLSDANAVFNKLPKWRTIFESIDVPLPPIGSTRIAIKDFDLKVDDNGYASVSAEVRSVVAPNSEPLLIRFFGKIVLEDKKLLIRNVESQVDDLFARDSEVSIAFNEILEELINPVVNFSKFEDNRFKIEDVDLKFDNGKVKLSFNLKFHPPEKLI